MESERRLRYYGWRVVLAANLGVMVGFSLYAYTFSIFMKPLAAQFGWNRQAIAQGFAISALAAAICSPLVGQWLFDRRGPRRLLLACIALFGCAFLTLGLSQSGIWQFYLTCFMIGAVGNVMQMGYAHAISTWFSDYRGTALGVVLAGEGIGLMIFPVLAQTLIGCMGWRAAYGVLGSLILLIGLPPAFLYARSRQTSEMESRASDNSGCTWQQGLRSYSFWVIVIVLFLDSISINGAMAHQVPLLTDHKGIRGKRGIDCFRTWRRQPVWAAIDGLAAGPLFRAVGCICAADTGLGRHFCISPRAIFFARFSGGHVAWPGCRWNFQHYAVSTDALFRSQVLLDALRPDLDFLCSCGRRGSRYSGACVRPHRFLHLYPDGARIWLCRRRGSDALVASLSDFEKRRNQTCLTLLFLRDSPASAHRWCIAPKRQGR